MSLWNSKLEDAARSDDFSKNLRCRLKSIYRMAALLLVFFLLPTNAFAAADNERISQIKAAFMLNIARFVVWPPEALDPKSDRLLLCLYRSNSYGEAITSIEGEPVGGRRLRITTVENIAESAPCNILLIAADEFKAYREEAQTDILRPMLIIADRTDEEASAEPFNNVIVSLVRNSSRIGFEINLERSRQVGLKMSSKLLKLATIVDGS